MSTLIAIVGVPGTGKSTLMKSLLERYQWEDHRPIKFVDGYLSKEEDIFIMGKYEEGEVFSGTDKLSMAVQPNAIEYMKTDPAKTVIFEGDRLTTTSFFHAVKSAGNKLFIIELTVPDEVREQRYLDRGSDQSKKFIQSRFTKIKNVKGEFGPNLLDDGDITTFEHKTPEDTEKVLSFIESLIENSK